MQIAQFDSVFQPNSSYRDCWPEVEGLAMTLQRGRIDYNSKPWCRPMKVLFFLTLPVARHRKTCQLTYEIVGCLVLAIIDALKKQDVFKPNSDIRNLGSVLFMFIRWNLEPLYFGIYVESLSSMCKVVDLAEEANVKLTAPHDFEKDYDKIKSIRDSLAEWMDKWENVDW
jgi:hypothetical protein